MKETTECSRCHGGTGQAHPCGCPLELVTLRQRVAELEKDAARYRWLKVWNKTDGFDETAIDKEIAIDRAVAAAEQAQEGE